MYLAVTMCYLLLRKTILCRLPSHPLLSDTLQAPVLRIIHHVHLNGNYIQQHYAHFISAGNEQESANNNVIEKPSIQSGKL